MLRQLRNIYNKRLFLPTINTNRTFLTNDYKCEESWSTHNSSPLVNKINLNDFYNQLDSIYSSKGVISALDVDLFAHAVKDSIHLDELKELLHKLRLSAETGNMLESTPHATIRNYIKFGSVVEIIQILKDPLNFGVFLDDYTANILLDELLQAEKYELAANVAALYMLQEEYNNELTCCLSQYAAYKYIVNYIPPEPTPPETPPKKVEEIKIRVKFLRNPYFDDHFDIKDTILLSGKTLAWISETKSNNLNMNLQLIGWLYYKKYDKLLGLTEQVSKSSDFKVYKELLELLVKEKNTEAENNNIDQCISILQKVPEHTESSLEESLKIAIENAINKVQKRDVENQQQLFKSWHEIREQKLQEQTERLDRAKRMEIIEQKQKELEQEEQKLWFFDNEDKIDLQIEEKEKKVASSNNTKKKNAKSSDENYVPPEILPKRK